MTYAAVAWWAGARHAVSVVAEPPTFEPLTVDEAKLRAGLTWLPGDERDALLAGFITAARARVEMDTGLALCEHEREVRFDYLDADCPIQLPGQCAPLMSVDEAFVRLADGTQSAIDPAAFVIDSLSNPARLVLRSTAVPQSAGGLQPWGLRITAGWPDAATIPPLLVHAVGLLAGHYFTSGRDVIAIGTIATDLPFGYEHVISGYRPALI